MHSQRRPSYWQRTLAGSSRLYRKGTLFMFRSVHVPASTGIFLLCPGALAWGMKPGAGTLESVKLVEKLGEQDKGRSSLHSRTP